MTGQPWTTVRWVLVAQLLLTCIAAALATALTGWSNGLFVLLGGMAATALAALFALRAFSVDAAVDARAAFAAMARAEAIKLVAAVVFFIFVAKVIPQHFGPVIIGFCAATLSYFLALPFAGKRS